MMKRKGKRGDGAAKETTAVELGSPYEKVREERIKENLERIQKLGILNIKSTLERSPKSPKSFNAKITASPLKLPLPPPPRRSSRLQNASPISYAEPRVKKDENSVTDESALVPQGQTEEVYTDEHAALLGSCETSWTLFADGYDNDGKRIYDPVKGKTCHQCRQKTLGHHTCCSKCNLVQGQFCGDCLYMRYGENVLEVEKNVSWICPVCRGICNCSICRTKKGWAPTGSLYRKVLNLGYKSVAHYLIQTRRIQTSSGNQTSLNPSLSSEEALDSKTAFNTETADDNSNDAETEEPSNQQEPPMPESGLNAESPPENDNICLNTETADDNSNDAETEEPSNQQEPPMPESGLNEESPPENDNICLNHKHRDQTNEAKEPAEAEKPRLDSIASRLRKRVPRAAQ